jgi:serine phosphatase RsbU (regulator of sigma subunit)
MSATEADEERVTPPPGREVARPRLAPGLSFRAFPAREVSDRLTRGDGVRAAGIRQGRILEVLREAAHQLVVHRPLDDLFELLLDLLFAAVPAERGAVLLREGTGTDLALRARRQRPGAPPLAVSRTVARRVLEEGVVITLGDALRAPSFRGSESLVLGRVRSALCAPLWFAHQGGEEVVGVVYLDAGDAVDAFDEEDVGLVTVIANIAAVKIHTARLLQEQGEKRRLEEELRVAAEVQAQLLPAAPPALPGWSLGALSRPCHAMGGDYYDWDLRPDGLRLALADVSGKGAAAALLMAGVRALVRALWGEEDLADAARRISESVRDSVPRARYATAFLARLEPASGRLLWVNAGHPPALIVRAGGAVEPLGTGGLPLGLLEGAAYEARETWLSPGDRLLVFSDGVIESTDRRGEELGTEGLLALARAGAQEDAAELARRLCRELEARAGGAPARDDRTLLVLERRVRAEPPPA